jgi:hypothetical protein
MIVGYNVVTLDPTIWDANSCFEDRGVIRGSSDCSRCACSLHFSLFLSFTVYNALFCVLVLSCRSESNMDQDTHHDPVEPEVSIS